MSDHVFLSDAARELSMDRSNARKFIIKSGFAFLRARDPKAGNQMALALTQEDFAMVKAIRENQGYGENPIVLTDNGIGFFYIVQSAPDLDPNRVKLGFATDPQGRLADYRTLSPTAHMLDTWPCRSSWERAATASITRIECHQIGQEVYVCENLETLLERAQQFFSLMPGHATASQSG